MYANTKYKYFTTFAILENARITSFQRSMIPEL